MDVFSGLTDDQMALLMCAGALAACGLMMTISYYIGGHHRPAEEIRIPLTDRDDREDSHRKAA